ncbi:type I-MYXAN CRISPR-associated protein Cmx8 [Thiococcus pfennigii]|nr:type I-MYXAN CRISPR-associated protein Cmx8 [Thiococcus pfennigii]
MDGAPPRPGLCLHARGPSSLRARNAGRGGRVRCRAGTTRRGQPGRPRGAARALQPARPGRGRHPHRVPRRWPLGEGWQPRAARRRRRERPSRARCRPRTLVTRCRRARRPGASPWRPRGAGPAPTASLAACAGQPLLARARLPEAPARDHAGRNPMSTQSRTDEQTLLLDYDLIELPTAQHKAGLAGLLLHLRSLERREVADAPQITRLGPFGATIRFDRHSLGVLFEDLYAGALEDVWTRSKYGGRDPLDEKVETIERDGKQENVKSYLYSELRPQCPVLPFWLEGGRESSWFKLWQGMLWSVLRAQPKTRGIYQSGTDRDKLADKLWRGLVKAQSQRGQGKYVIESIAGSLFIGAQDRNAEQVAFTGRIEHNLLLHFWQWATPVFVPRLLDPRKGSWEYQGFLFAVPEVADLEEFVDEMPRYWQGLNPAKIGYRPADALIDLPEEGGLEFLYHLGRHRVGRTKLRFSLHAVELYHQHKQGNNVRQLAAERLTPDPGLLGRYEEIRRYRHRHPLFKRLQIGNLVRGRPWYSGALDLFDRYAVELFVHGPQTPRGRFFGTDVRRCFEAVIADLNTQETPMSEDDRDKALQRLIYRVARNYVERRTRDRAGLPGDKDFKQLTPAEVAKYRDAKPKVATNAFLALRGRRDQDIAEYFTGTLCAVGFHLKEDDFLLLAEALMREPEKVKTLAMLALSAHSWSAPKADDTDAAASEPDTSSAD